MNKKWIAMLFLLGTIYNYAASVRGKIVNQHGKAVPGIHVYWEKTNHGTVSDAKGEFQIGAESSTNKLIVSGVSFQSDTLVVSHSQEPLLIKLNETIELRELSVVQQGPGVLKPRFVLLQTEKITAHELTKAACCNLSESFETNPSVDVSYSDAATGAKQLKLLGLSGTYVQMLTENIPNLRGLSSAYGMSYIPGPWIESINLSKGTGSVVNGYEAFTGQINVEYKKPQTSEVVAANMFASDAGRVEANVNAGIRLNEELSTGVMLHASDEFLMLDGNGDGYMDMPEIRQYNFLNRWYFRNKNYVSQAFIKALNERRMGGTMDQSYKIDINTNRYEFFLKNGYVFNPKTETSVGFIVSGSHHDQQAHYGLKMYTGLHQNLYLNLIYMTNLAEHHKITAGFSFNYDKFEETMIQKMTMGGMIENNLENFNSKEYIPGFFAEYGLHLHHEFQLLAGMRLDYHNQWGLFATPRLHLKYNPTESLFLRATTGMGYRSPKMLAENNYYLASNRMLKLDDDLRMESAWNSGVSVQHFIKLFNRELSVTGEWYYTRFLNQVVIDTDTDAHAVHFYNLNGKSYAHSFQIEANMEVIQGLSVTLAHRINDVKTTIGGELRDKPLTNRYKGLATASYTTPLKKWQFDFTAQFNGGGRLPDPNPVNPRWDAEFDPYTILNAQITKYFRTWSLYLGSENMTGFVQENPIIDVGNPFGSHFDATNIWGPTHGRKIYIGFRWGIER